MQSPGAVSSEIFVPDGQQVLSNVLAGLEQKCMSGCRRGATVPGVARHCFGSENRLSSTAISSARLPTEPCPLRRHLRIGQGLTVTLPRRRWIMGSVVPQKNRKHLEGVPRGDGLRLLCIAEADVSLLRYCSSALTLPTVFLPIKADRGQFFRRHSVNYL